MRTLHFWVGILPVLASVTIAVMEHHGQKQVGEERGYLFICSHFYITVQDRDANRAGIWSQELMQRPWMGAVYWHSPHALLLYICNQLHRNGTTHNGL